jgi:protein-tyrosine-phosphatase
MVQLRLHEVGIANEGRSVGFDIEGQPATSDVVRLLADRGVDVSGHRSRRITDDDMDWADLVLAAEHDHVVSMSGRWPGAFGRIFTLPEVVTWGEQVGPRGERTLRRWLADIAVVRPTALDYMDATVGELTDPTGLSPTVWRASVTEIDDLTARLADLLA